MAKSKAATSWRYIRPLLMEQMEGLAAAGATVVGMLVSDPKRGLLLVLPWDGSILTFSGNSLATEMEGAALAFNGFRNEGPAKEDKANGGEAAVEGG